MKIKKINNLEKITDNVYILKFERDFNFLPGQVIGISLDEKTPPRLYSIASSNNDPQIKILFDEKKDGILTPWLSLRKPGDRIYISNPSGNFICDPDEKAYWIASGTGIAPFASMFFSGNKKNKILIHGERNSQHFYFQEEFSKELGKNYIRCSSREPGYGLYEGRLTVYLKDLKTLEKDYKYYICGSAEMVVDTRDILIAQGINYDSIISEIYF